MSDRQDHETADLTRRLDAIASGLTPDGAPVSPDAVVRFSRVAVPHAEHVGITLIRPPGGPRTIAASDPAPEDIDTLQYRAGEGPCLDAAAGPTVVLASDLATDPRWPRFGPRCVEQAAVHAVLSARLPVGGSDEAALNLYAHDPGSFGDDDVATASIIAPFAALVVEAELRRRDVNGISQALESNRTIGTAVGILMAVHGITREEAFARLRRASMDLNAKMRDVASEVEHTGALPRRRPARGPGC